MKASDVARRVVARYTEARVKTAAFPPFSKNGPPPSPDDTGPIDDGNSGGSNSTRRNIPPDHDFDPRALKPMSKALFATSVGLGHALTAYRHLNRLKSTTVSPDGMLGGRGYVMAVADARRKLYEACESLSSIADTLYDEIQAPHWKPKLGMLDPNEAGDVARLIEEAQNILADPEDQADEEISEIEGENDKQEQGVDPDVDLADEEEAALEGSESPEGVDDVEEQEPTEDPGEDAPWTPDEELDEDSDALDEGAAVSEDPLTEEESDAGSEGLTEDETSEPDEEESDEEESDEDDSSKAEPDNEEDEDSDEDGFVKEGDPEGVEKPEDLEEVEGDPEGESSEDQSEEDPSEESEPDLDKKLKEKLKLVDKLNEKAKKPKAKKPKLDAKKLKKRKKKLVEDETASGIPGGGPGEEAKPLAPALKQAGKVVRRMVRKASADLPSGTSAIPTMEDRGMGDGPYGSWNPMEDATEDAWGLENWSDSDKSVEAESMTPSDLDTPTDADSWGLGDGEGNATDTKDEWWGDHSDLPGTPSGSSGDPIPDSTVDVFINERTALLKSLLPGDEQEPVARSDYFPGPKGNMIQGCGYAEAASELPNTPSEPVKSVQPLVDTDYIEEDVATPYVHYDYNYFPR